MCSLLTPAAVGNSFAHAVKEVSSLESYNLTVPSTSEGNKKKGKITK